MSARQIAALPSRIVPCKKPARSIPETIETGMFAHHPDVVDRPNQAGRIILYAVRKRWDFGHQSIPCNAL
jgi:hypothetical protein